MPYVTSNTYPKPSLARRSTDDDFNYYSVFCFFIIWDWLGTKCHSPIATPLLTCWDDDKFTTCGGIGASMLNLASKLGQIGPKLDKSGTF